MEVGSLRVITGAHSYPSLKKSKFTIKEYMLSISSVTVSGPPLVFELKTHKYISFYIRIFIINRVYYIYVHHPPLHA